jgi:molybdopterin converting factor small subunit
MRILFFGSLGEKIGRNVDFELPSGGCTIGDLRLLLVQRYPDASADLARHRARACVGDSIVDEQFEVDGASEVHFFPPLSGG